MRRQLKDLNVIDNFMFNELMMQEDKEKSKEFVRSILEPIIQKKIEVVEFEGQRVVQGIDVNKRGIQLDAYVKVYENAEGEEVADVALQSKPVIYAMEPNKIARDDKLRARAYHSIIDAKILKSGERFKSLSDVYVIFILPYDPFGRDFMLYTIKNQCVEDLGMDYNDGATTLFLYAKGTKNIPSQRVADMLNFIIDSTEENAQKANLSNIQKMINQIKSDDGMEEKFMLSWEEQDYFEEQGYLKGKEEGIKENRKDMLNQFLKNGGTKEQAIMLLGAEEKELIELIGSQET